MDRPLTSHRQATLDGQFYGAGASHIGGTISAHGFTSLGQNWRGEGAFIVSK